MDFSSLANQRSYAARSADASWLEQMRALLNGAIPRRVADIGCGGGIYTRAWRVLGAGQVIGVDTAAAQIEVARGLSDDPDIRYRVASAYACELPDASQDLVFSRAVIHHLQDHRAAMAEAFRILAPGGMLIVQDRTIDDVLQPPSPNHFRAYFFTAQPRLLEDEYRRRPDSATFVQSLTEAGFADIAISSFWETRLTYRSEEDLRADLLARTGRSILHQLTDAELGYLTEVILAETRGQYPLEEQDRWTMWTARKPG